jgi:hypothetical protein
MSAALYLSAAWIWAVLSTPALPPVRQIIREVVLDANTQVHAVDIVGWPNLTTAIQFTDTFEAANVLCGQCVESTGGNDTGVVNEQRERNWFIEKRVAEHVIHVRPATLPSLGNPASAFATNIYVGLHGGHAVNIALRLLTPDSVPAHTGLAADAVVTVKLPGQAALTGKLAEGRRRIFEDFEKKAAHKSYRLMLERLHGKVQCHSIAWRRPYRTDKAVVRLNQLCVSAGPQRTYWATFEVENRSDAPLVLDAASLEPEGLAMVVADPLAFALTQHTLAFGEHAEGIALCALTEQSVLPASWRLRLTPSASEKQSIDVEHLSF